jgi:putative membrane protein
VIESGASVPDDGALPGWQRLSPRSLVVRPVMDLVRLLPVLAGLLLLHSRVASTQWWGVAAAGLTVGASVVRWATTRYRITADRVYLRHGLLSTRAVSVARDRIRSVDFHARLLHRMLGVCRVSIGTGRNDLRGGGSIHLDGLTVDTAERLRFELLSVPPVQSELVAGPAGSTQQDGLPAAARTAAAVHDLMSETEIARLRPGWLRFAPLTLTGLVVLGVLSGVVFQVSEAAGGDTGALRPAHLILAALRALPSGQRVLLAAVAVLAVYALVATAGYVAVFWNFRIARVGPDTLRITRGLLSVRATSIARARLRGAEISEPLLLRAAGGARCLAVTTGLRVGEGAERGGSVLLPPAPKAAAVRVASEVLGVPPRFCTAPLASHGRSARRRRYVRAVGVSAVIAVTAVLVARAQGAPGWIWLAVPVLLTAAAGLAADRYRSLGHRLEGRWLLTGSGSLVRRRIILATDGIIGWRIRQTWFQRRLGLVTLTATTAAGRQRYSVPDVSAAEALAVAAAATPGLTVPFLAADG